MINNINLLQQIAKDNFFNLAIKIKNENTLIFATSENMPILIEEQKYFPLLESFSFGQNILQEENIVIFNNSEKFLNLNLNYEINLKIYRKIENELIYEDFLNGFITKFESLDENRVKIYFKSKILKLDQEIGEFFSPICRAEFCDAKCKKDISEYIHLVKILDIVNIFEYKIEMEKEDNFFLGGIISIPEKNFKTKIIYHLKNIIKLAILPYFQINQGDFVSLIQPCNKTMESCKKFNNIINFRAEPFIK